MFQQIIVIRPSVGDWEKQKQQVCLFTRRLFSFDYTHCFIRSHHLQTATGDLKQ